MPNHQHQFLKTLDLFYVFFLFCLFCLVSGEVFPEKLILLEFKNSISDPFELLSSWRADNSDHCSWFGVSCDSNSRILELKIRGNSFDAFSCSENSEIALHGFGIRRNCSDRKGKLVGKLSPVIAGLTELRVLSLPFNELDGEIPNEVWGLKNLEVLDLEGNLITGNLSSEFSGLRKLRIFNLGFNRIVGKFPNSLSKCRVLRVLNLAGNQINDGIPGFVGSLKKLKGLYLSFNRLVGPIPDSFWKNCQNLEHLDLSGNYLNGEIPRSLGNCSQLRTVLLFSNAFYGVIPSEFGRLRRLDVLDVSRNSLGGPVPAKLGNCASLSVLVLSSDINLLTNVRRPRGDAPFELFRAALDDYNFFEGSIPVEITMLPKLKIIWAPSANLEGKFPSNWGHCDSLEMVNFAENFFTGEICGVFGGCKNLHYLNLSSNALSGQLDEKLPVPCMTIFDISGNLMSGLIPSFNHNACPRLPSLTSDLLQPNNPSSVYLSLFTHKTRFENPLPFSRVNVPIIHHFGQNNFTGAITLLPIAPERLQKQNEYAFLADGNNLTGSFGGNLFGKCDGINGMIVNVSNNKISGQIPSNISMMCRSLKFLDASRNQISGSIPQGLGYLKSLILLNLSWNKLNGQIPVDLGQMKHLKYLRLAGNNLTGFIPSVFEQLHSLEVLELSSNSLRGEIPQGLAYLRNLTVLLLNNNKLSGKLPLALANMTSLTSCNVSFNNLSGPWPLDIKLLNCSSFLGNPLLPCPIISFSVPPTEQQGSNKSQNHAASPSESNSKSGKKGINSIEIASIISASAIVTILLAFVALFFYTRKWIPNSRVQVSESSDRREIIVFNDIGVPLTYDNVVQATGNFNASNCIGSGGFGSTYRAEVSPGTIVAVKRLTIERCQGVPQFAAEISTLGRIRHPNLITLVGYYASAAEMFLIYNFLPGGNLEEFIQERTRRALDWKILHKIALDIACALTYLHDRCNPRVLHRDIKPSNILLDNDLNAYLSDFGLSRLLGTSETHATTGVAGTFGYVAPEYALTCRVSDKSDVYSYGVVLLELISDKRALDPSFSSHGDGFNIVSWVCMLLRRDQANEVFAAGLWDAGPQDSLVDILYLAVLCTVDSLSARPTMKQVLQRLKQLQPPST
ncbi:unnamed protein product [Ilex paraguariensis]|uniref:non-specific serine/threonine protein kinase n=1 Tax=Ilex paraguariensis TaxID=185542 RepID=A0ABC8UYN5_9AQUA